MAENHDRDAEAEVARGALPTLILYALRRAQAALAQDLRQALAAEDIRAGQFAALEVLGHNPGLRQNQASAALDMKTTNFVPLFDDLERRGLAERRPIPGDRRAKGLFLTELGTQTWQRLEALVSLHDARTTARLGQDGKTQLLGLLARLAEPAFD